MLNAMIFSFKMLLAANTITCKEVSYTSHHSISLRIISQALTRSTRQFLGKSLIVASDCKGVTLPKAPKAYSCWTFSREFVGMLISQTKVSCSSYGMLVQG